MASAKFEMDLGPLERIVEEYGEDVLNTDLPRAFKEVLDDIEALMVQLAPIDTGNLESSSTVRVNRSGTVVGGKIRGVIRFGAPYAARVHELPEEARGPRTRQKPGNIFGDPGPKYVERVLRGTQRDLSRTIGQALARIWRSKGSG